MRLFLLLLTFFVISCSQLSSNSNSISGKSVSLSESDINLDVTKMTLDNGLRVLLVQNSKLPIFSYYTFFGVGGKHERKGITGASHFLEHMMFKGAKNFGAGAFDRIIEGNGGASNAYTTNDETVYYEKLPAKALELIIKVEADRIQNLLLEPEAFEKERNVVLEERKMRYENSPGGKMYLNVMQSMFEGTPYGRSVIGDIEDLKTVTRNQIMDYFKTFYAPNNAIVVIVGDFNVSTVKEQIKQAYSAIPSSEKLDSERKKSEDAKLFKWKGKYNRDVKVNATNPIPKFMYAFQGVPLGKREAYVLDILSSILGDGKSSHFNQLFVDSKRPLLSSIGVGNYNLSHKGIFYISGNLLERTNLRKFKRILNKEIKRACGNKVISARNVQKIKNNYLVSLYSGLETNSGIARFIGSSEQDHNDYSHYKEELEIYNSIQADEVISACHKVFDVKKAIFTSVWNKHPKSKKRKK